MNIIKTSVQKQEFEWKIYDFLNKIESESSCESREFKIWFEKVKTQWHFQCLFKKPFMSLHLLHTDGEGCFSIFCEAFVRTVNKEIKFFNSGHIISISSSLLTIKHLVDGEIIGKNPDIYLENGALTLGIKIKVTNNQEVEAETCKRCVWNLKCLSEIFENYYNTEAYYDFAFFCADGKMVKAHRLILANHSRVMKAMFDTDMVEAKTDCAHLDDIDAETMTEILRFMYTQNVKNLPHLAPKLLYGADKYEITKLRKICVDWMNDNIGSSNVVEFFVLAEQFNESDLLLRCLSFIQENYEVLREKQDWELLDKKHLVLMVDYFGRNPHHIQILETDT